jgi:cytoskeletal protein RodZ
MASLGQELKRERELRGISLKEIADSTRISLRYLQALEDDRRDLIPGQFFVRAILRSYAKSIGLEENQVLNKYDEIVQFEEQMQYRESKAKPRPAEPKAAPRKHKSILVLAGCIVIIIAAALLYFLVLATSKPASTPTSVRAEPTTTAVAPAPPPPTAAPSAGQAAPQARGLSLQFTFSEETWLHIYADGQSIWDGIKVGGENLEVNAQQEVVINTGNAGGMAFTINGKKAKPLGPRGAVRQDVKITVENAREFLTPEGES